MIGRLGLVMLIVSDLKRSVAFYRDVFELEVEFESEGWSQVSAGTISIGLHPAFDGGAPTPGGAELTFYVDNVHATVATLRERGAEIAVEPRQEEFGGLLAIVKDPDGYQIHLLQYEH
jgi:catechol 2,3-dioxygenase-like lactoylglutathione lyase family enzyme